VRHARGSWKSLLSEISSVLKVADVCDDTCLEPIS
jgi:hypothetical protein